MAKNIYFEARNEATVGQLAVAQTVINRVNSSRFPNSICDVVYQGLHTMLGAQKGHSGYERLIIDSKTGKSIPSAGYFHYLHHKYFECNYGELTSPLDKWFGSFHDGTKKAHHKIFKQNG